MTLRLDDPQCAPERKEKLCYAFTKNTAKVMRIP